MPAGLSARGARLAPWLVGLLALVAPAADAQPLSGRTPNLNGPWVPVAATSHFSFLHRFQVIEEKVLNYPTLRLDVGLPWSTAIGATYTSNSDLGAGTPNEWEAWLRKGISLGRRVALAGTVAWNTAAESVDGEVAGRVRLGPFSLHGVARGFSAAYGSDEAATALGGGLAWHLTPRLALVGDAARVVSTDTLPTAWSAGVHMVIPGSPHTLGFVASNVGVTTLQGASRGLEDEEGDPELRYGFAFTMPLGTWSQWARIFRGETDAGRAADVVVRDFAFAPAEIVIRPGETVAWINEDEVAHSVTSDDGTFDSGLIQPGEGYSRRFDAPGRHPYHCTPHPFMKGVVVVEAGPPAEGAEPGN